MSFAGAAEDDADTVVLEIVDESLAVTSAPSSPRPSPAISTSDLANLDPFPSPTLALRADRNRLIKSSSYFRALLGGSFSESGMGYVQINCNLEAAVLVLRYMFGPSTSAAITHKNFLLLLEGGLFLGVEALLMECERWFGKMCSQKSSSQLIPLDFIIETWNFAQEHGVTFVQDICPEYVAQNFVQAMSRRSFAKISYDLLCSSIESPQLTVDSEKQLCEAILYWMSENVKPSEQPHPNSLDGQLCILSKVKICLLPLDFAAGMKKSWVKFGNYIVCAILNLLKDSSQTLLDAIVEDKLEDYRIRITENSKKIVLSGCPQITTALLYMSVLPTDLDAALKRKIVCSYTHVDYQSFNLCKELETAVLSLGSVHEVDLSKCPKVHFAAAIDWLELAFPNLRIFRASYCLQFQWEDLLYLLLRCPWISEIDVTVKTSAIIPKQSVTSSSCEVRHQTDPNPRRHSITGHHPSYNTQRNSVFSNISKLTLEGRNDINDLGLLEISILKNSLCYINIRNCTLLTDDGISTLLLKCPKIQSMVLSYTNFGKQSIQALCTFNPSDRFPDHNDEYAHVMAFRMEELHLDGCQGIDQDAMSQLLSNVSMVKLLCLRDTPLTDDALCNFVGSSLECLDISETIVSMISLAPIIRKNYNLRCLKATGCRSLLLKCDEAKLISGNKFGDILREILHICCLEDVEMGWGFSPVRTEDLIPTFSKLRKMTVGLGTTLAENILHALPEICPFLESLVLRFQVISDRFVRHLLESSINLQVLCLYSCFGNLTSFCFQTKVSALRILRLEWVAPWITNEDLITLTQNCSNLVELSLTGCILLDSNSQEIISSGWPNLTCLHLEECGQITLDGASLIFNCKALEDLLLRHTGRGVGRNIINDAISKLPLLQKLALDLCDASEEGYDSPNNPEGKMIRTVKMSRCKSVRSCFEPYKAGSTRPVHKETIVLEWSSKELRTTIVKERV